ncbi:putative WRKY transcription factor 52 [Morella rubra]|uniref:Putative WRKY transcription factor 52 n=1 Tax=Morella rubra TaxID=262757 RepID=A0A6A1V595_9ROSI|nr:putative WRKY transcription factor 52 [Morella rubra]
MDIVENFSKLHDKYLCSMLWPRDLLRSMPTNELRVMDWLGFPLKSLPTNFQSDHLVQLNMPCSRIKQLWKGIKEFDGTRPDYDQFVEFVYHFETDEGILKSPLVLRAPKDHSLGPIGFGVYIPAKWFLERSNNLEGWSYIKASVETRSPHVEVKEYGVRLYYRNSASELYYAFNYFAFDLSNYLANCYWGTVSPAVEPVRF